MGLGGWFCERSGQSVRALGREDSIIMRCDEDPEALSRRRAVASLLIFAKELEKAGRISKASKGLLKGSYSMFASRVFLSFLPCYVVPATTEFRKLACTSSSSAECSVDSAAEAHRKKSRLIKTCFGFET